MIMRNSSNKTEIQKLKAEELFSFIQDKAFVE